MQGAAELPGDVGDRQAVEVAQCQRCPLLRGKPGQCGMGNRDVKMLVPGILSGLGSAGKQADPPLLTVGTPPVIDKLVPGNSDQPADCQLRRVITPGRRHRGHERLGGQILSQHRAPAARQEIAVHLRQGTPVQRSQQRLRCCLTGRPAVLGAHI